MIISRNHNQTLFCQHIAISITSALSTSLQFYWHLFIYFGISYQNVCTIFGSLLILLQYCYVHPVRHFVLRPHGDFIADRIPLPSCFYRQSHTGVNYSHVRVITKTSAIRAYNRAISAVSVHCYSAYHTSNIAEPSCLIITRQPWRKLNKPRRSRNSRNRQ